MKRNIIQRFFDKLFQRTIIINVPEVKGNELYIYELSEEGHGLHNALGISDDRLVEIGRIAEKAYSHGSKNKKSVVWALEDASKECKHANELYMLIVLTEKIHRANQNPIEIIFGQLGGKR